MITRTRKNGKKEKERFRFRFHTEGNEQEEEREDEREEVQRKKERCQGTIVIFRGKAKRRIRFSPPFLDGSETARIETSVSFLYLLFFY